MYFREVIQRAWWAWNNAVSHNYYSKMLYIELPKLFCQLLNINHRCSKSFDIYSFDSTKHLQADSYKGLNKGRLKYCVLWFGTVTITGLDLLLLILFCIFLVIVWCLLTFCRNTISNEQFKQDFEVINLNSILRLYHPSAR